MFTVVFFCLDEMEKAGTILLPSLSYGENLPLKGTFQVPAVGILAPPQFFSPWRRRRRRRRWRRRCTRRWRGRSRSSPRWRRG